MTFREWLLFGAKNGWVGAVEETDPEPAGYGDGVLKRRLTVRLGAKVFGNSKAWLAGTPNYQTEHLWDQAWIEAEATIGRWLRTGE